MVSMLNEECRRLSTFASSADASIQKARDRFLQRMQAPAPPAQNPHRPSASPVRPAVPFSGENPHSQGHDLPGEFMLIEQDIIAVLQKLGLNLRDARLLCQKSQLKTPEIWRSGDVGKIATEVLRVRVM